MNIPADHPRRKSLLVRARLSDLAREGVVDPTGLIAHGRGEAFDYLMGERSTAPAMEAERAAAAHLLRARRPVVCVNGNAAALDPRNLALLARTVGAAVEVNIFHRTEARMEKIISHMEAAGAEGVLGRSPDSRIPGLSSDRALCTREGIFESDAILVPIEDGDRAQALAAMGKTVISIDLNPLSRTSAAATVPVCDEMTRALENMIAYARELKGDEAGISEAIGAFSADRCRRETVEAICASLMSGYRER
ncbi:MAG: phosphopantothenate/pantothenate synthetase [Candidatus Methanoplasma sp.]|nr:phosphopantothenate/pantothenate synthetase [Candidatus Methanoplasma sp.]